MTGAGAGTGILVFTFAVVALSFALSIPVTVFWVITLVEVARLPEPQFQAAGTTKTTWLVVVALTGGIGSLVWWLSKRREVQAAAGAVPFMPPGWYPDPGRPGAVDALRWWDGLRWSEDTNDLWAPTPTASFN